MANKATPTITYTEILSRAINSVEAEIKGWESTCATLPAEHRSEMFAAATKELVAKLDTLKTLYRIETGVDFD